ncbi:hypothetical protein KR200_000284 [Drosophila serrata]|nr:hypothetical protein KR200_000284 [Drosophila serrata]
MNIQRLDEIQKAGSPPRFITIGNRVLVNRPSFVVLKDSSTRNHTEEHLDDFDLSQSGSSHTQLPGISSNAGCQTDEMCCQVDLASRNNSGNDVPTNRNLSHPTDVPSPGPLIQYPAIAKQTQLAEETRKEEEGSNVISLQAQVHTTEIKQQNTTTSTAPYVTISFTPVPQAGSRCGTSVAPCQQLPSAATSNASSCSFCTSNCCLPRPPQACQMPKKTCCSPRLAAPQNLGSCLLTSYGYPYCCCSRSISCWPVSSPQHQSSLGFSGHYNRCGMVLANQISHHLFQPVLSTTGFAPGGSFHPGISPCLGHCPMNVHHNPHCQRTGFVNNHQQYPLQMGRQFPLQMGQQYKLQMGQLPQLRRQTQCDCCLMQQPKNGMGSEVSGDEGFNRDRFVPQVSPSSRAQSLSGDQDHHEHLTKKKSSTETPRAYGGASHIKRNFNTTALYAARSGRTCLILRPTATAMVPRLLTRRISRYTSVIMAPK